MRHGLLVLLLTAAWWSASCSSPTSPGAPATFTLAPGQSATYGQLSVTFDSVVVDSRCPEEAFVLCIQFGDAFLKVRAKTPRTEATSYDVQVLDPQKRRFEHAGFGVEVTGLEPKPFISGPIDPSDYRLSLRISE
jgi:hypothetical protein